ncbi:MAG TPA: ATP-binding protein [Ligilactobacillus acidipiscis]|uniref:ATP-binding protein n=1 Tax=Ligilactobacillus acidipiscis TaxID=89059 RepID=A0A921K1E6_9LACO|nr:ATP-binding protein [Ligilactobacillus acidipiscis]
MKDVAYRKERQERQRQANINITNMWLKKKANVMRNSSLFSEKGALKHKFSDIKPVNKTFEAAAKKAKKISEEYKQLDTDKSGSVQDGFITFLQGSPGVGKTMLGVCILNDVQKNFKSPVSCLFVSITLLQRYALEKNNDMKSFDVYDGMMRNIRKADFVLIDDLGSETSMNNRDIKFANQTTSSMLFNIFDSRLGRSTIITTNYSSSQFEQMYNEKILDRCVPSNEDHIIKFEGIPSYRRKML